MVISYLKMCVLVSGIAAIAGSTLLFLKNQRTDDVAPVEEVAQYGEQESASRGQSWIASTTDSLRAANVSTDEKVDRAAAEDSFPPAREERNRLAAPEGVKKLATRITPTAEPAPTATSLEATAVPERESDDASAVFALNPEWRSAVVNIFCVGHYGGSITSGSGVIIDPRGVIVTNAHVATSLLFTNFPAPPSPSLNDCQVRTGSPAYPLYRAEILHIPDEWIRNSLDQLYKPDDTDYVYGKKDYALLFITERTDPTAPLPTTFPYVPISIKAPSQDEFVYIIGYPAAFIGGISAQRDLYSVSSPAVVASTRSISGSAASDAVTFKGTIAGQQGSSGGAIVVRGGFLTGIPTFSDDKPGATTDDRNLNAITLEYVDRDLKSDTGLSVSEFLSRGDFRSVAERFISEFGSAYQRLYVNTWKEREGTVIPGVTY